jgi:nicotinamide-nucleotide amidase
MNATIISIGDELLIGQVVNTNAASIAKDLNSVGIAVGTIITVGDDPKAILESFRESYTKCDVVVVTGGLGPTHDDVTRAIVCEFFGTDLTASLEARQHIEQFLQSRNRPWSEAATNQTLVPRGATVIPNRHGTAPGELFERDGKYFIVMPGVPYEMDAMMKEFVVPFFSRRASGKYIAHRTLNTTGIPESSIAERLGNLDALFQDEKLGGVESSTKDGHDSVEASTEVGFDSVKISTNVGLAFLPSSGGVRLRITVIGTDRGLCLQKSLTIEQRIRARVGKYIYGTEEQRLEEVVGSLLAERELTIAVAESCTGGHLADTLTNVPGSSRYLERAVVTYSDQSKIDLLHVGPELLEKHGAVSREVAEAMAFGVRTISGADLGISTTGIAGPGGGTAGKPVGLVWIGFCDPGETWAVKFNLGGERLQIKERATHASLEIIRRKLLNIS